MLFNTPLFFAFACVFFALYCFVFTRENSRVLLIVVSSMLFYSCWDYRFLPLLILTAAIDFYIARWMSQSAEQRHRKRLLMVSLALNLGVLGIFKYLNFMIESVHETLNFIGLSVSLSTLNIVLPAGISFYTFQSMSYTIDVYRGDMPARKNFLPFFATVTFFPHLVAGPILRTSRILPQIEHFPPLNTDNIKYGFVLITFGLVKKTIADLLAAPAETLFNAPGPVSWLETLTGVLAFAAQIYGDFSGYSDIAIGLALLIGIKIPLNFNTPYFSVSPVDFWRRWHISLSTWLRDYLYISLGGNRNGKQLRNVFITMLLGGLWHGAAWTFIWWGAFHGAIISITHLLRATRIGGILAGIDSRALRLLQWLFTFYLVCIGWIFFRAESLSDAFAIIAQLHVPDTTLEATPYTGIILGMVIFALLFCHAIDYQIIKRQASLQRLFWYWLPALILANTFVFLIGEPGYDFIYFQF